MKSDGSKMDIDDLNAHIDLGMDSLVIFEYKVAAMFDKSSTVNAIITFPSGTRAKAVFLCSFYDCHGHAEVIWSFSNLWNDSVTLWCSNLREKPWGVKAIMRVGVHRDLKF